MKRSLFIIMLTASLISASAQDTLHQKDFWRIGNYFFYDTIPPDDYHFYPATYVGPELGGEMGKYFFTKDSITIYGIAAAVRVLTPGPDEVFYDTTDEYVYEYLRLYSPCPDSLRCQRSVKVHLGHTPVAYYIDFDLWHTPPTDRYFSPVYECYFRPKVVADSFYVGMTEWCRIPFIDSTGHWWYQRNRILGLVNLGMTGMEFVEQWFICFYSQNSHTWSRVRKPQSYTMIFPILTPNPDTTATGDTLGVAEASLLDRLTGVMPNPAAEKARVVSSFGMSMVKVYNASGALVHTQRADGLYVDLDVSRWPAGTYLVRIHTPQGIATKRLVVTR